MQWHKLNILKRQCRTSANKLHAAKQVYLTSCDLAVWSPDDCNMARFERTVTVGRILVTVCVKTLTPWDSHTYFVAYIWRLRISLKFEIYTFLSCSVHLRLPVIHKHMKVLKGTFGNHLSKLDLTGLGRSLPISNVTAINTHTDTQRQTHTRYTGFILLNS